jgi:hypothetical protein
MWIQFIDDFEWVETIDCKYWKYYWEHNLYCFKVCRKQF